MSNSTIIYKTNTVRVAGEFELILKHKRVFRFSKQQRIMFVFFILLITVIIIIIIMIKLNSAYDIFYDIIYF